MTRKVFLILLALVLALSVGLVACAPAEEEEEEEEETYELTIECSAGGSTTPGEGTHTYNGGEVVNLVAEPDEGFVFVDWSSEAGEFGDVNDATTTFTMPFESVVLVAKFARWPGPLSYFACYLSRNGFSDHVGDNWDVGIKLTDTFDIYFGELRDPEHFQKDLLFCNPMEKEHNGVLTLISNRDHHLTIYSEWQTGLGAGVIGEVLVSNQFGNQAFDLKGPQALAVPTHKVYPGSHSQPVGLDHFLLYAITSQEDPVNAVITLKDEFGAITNVKVTYPQYFANPVQKEVGSNVTDRQHPDARLVFYGIEIPDTLTHGSVKGIDQFGDQFDPWETFPLEGPSLIAVPSELLSFTIH